MYGTVRLDKNSILFFSKLNSSHSSINPIILSIIGDKIRTLLVIYERNNIISPFISKQILSSMYFNSSAHCPSLNPLFKCKAVKYANKFSSQNSIPNLFGTSFIMLDLIAMSYTILGLSALSYLSLYSLIAASNSSIGSGYFLLK